MEVSRKEAVQILWKRGILKWKLHDIQKKMYDVINESQDHVITMLCSRRIGKSYELCVLASEICINTPNAVVKYICPRKKMVKTIIGPIMRTIFSDSPKELRPEFKGNDSLYQFPNGSQIQLAGTDNGHAESIRGGFAHLCIVDEAGFCNDLSYVIKSILAPTTDTTNGKIILASTPPSDPNHEFVTEFIQPAEEKGKLLKYTIYDNPMMTEGKIKKIIERYTNGIHNPEFRREYLCHIIKDIETSVIPEFNDELIGRIVKDWKLPAKYDCYVSMDIGVKDFTVTLFAYYDYLKAKLVICDELVLNGPDLITDKLANLIKKKEIENFTDELTKDTFIPTRISDNNNLILLNDLNLMHNILFLPTAKDDKQAQLNFARIQLVQEKIIITPNCKTTIAHLKNATWNKSRTSFERKAGFGHYDAVDSFLYLVRNVNFNKNPYGLNLGSHSEYYRNTNNEIQNSNLNSIKNIFKIK